MNQEPKNAEAGRLLPAAHGSAVAPVTLAKRIRWLREQRGQTRGEFAKMIGVSPSLVSLWEDEKRNVSVPHLMKMCDAGGISLDFMCNSQLLPTFKMPESKPKRRKRVAAQPNVQAQAQPPTATPERKGDE